MLKTSDNDVAEGLHRLVALQTGFPATWAGAQAAQAAALARLGVPLATGLYDGSGLSRRDRLSPATLVAVLGQGVRRPAPEPARAAARGRSPSPA